MGLAGWLIEFIFPFEDKEVDERSIDVKAAHHAGEFINVDVLEADALDSWDEFHNFAWEVKDTHGVVVESTNNVLLRVVYRAVGQLAELEVVIATKLVEWDSVRFLLFIRAGHKS